MSKKNRQRVSAMVVETSDYNQFDLTDFNRNVEKTRFLRNLMLRQGWIDAFPMLVTRVRSNGRLKVKAGHHRFWVARELGIPVKYVLCNDSTTIFELEQATNPWSLNDYLVAHVRKEREAYVIVKEFRDRTGIPLGCCVNMLSGSLAGSGGSAKTRAFKSGTFQIDPDGAEHADQVAAVVAAAEAAEVPWATSSSFVNALSRAILVDECKLARLIQKMKLYAADFPRPTNSAEFLQTIEEIYNKKARRHENIPLAFLAKQQAHKRRLIAS